MKRIHNPVAYILTVLFLLPWQTCAALYLTRAHQSVWASLLVAANHKDQSAQFVTFPSQSFLIILVGSVVLDIALLLFSIYFLTASKSERPRVPNCQSGAMVIRAELIPAPVEVAMSAQKT